MRKIKGVPAASENPRPSKTAKTGAASVRMVLTERLGQPAMKLSSNGELYQYLVCLAAKLKEAGATPLSDEVLAASRTAWAIPVTEFLGESRIALRRVAALDVALLTQTERSDLLDVLSQLDSSFERR